MSSELFPEAEKQNQRNESPSFFADAYEQVSHVAKDYPVASVAVGAALIGAAAFATKGRALFSRVGQIAENEALPELGDGLFGAVSNGRYSNLLRNGEIGIQPGYLLYSGQVEGRFAMAPSAFRDLHSSYSEFIEAMRVANTAARDTRREAFAAANQLFEQKVLPRLATSGVGVDLAGEDGFFSLKNLYDVPMNRALYSKGAVFDMNTVGGMRALVQQEGSRLGREVGTIFPEFTEEQFAKAPAEQLLTAEQKNMILTASSLNENMRRLLEPSFIERLNAGERVQVPMALRLELPSADLALSGRRRAMIYFEETAHLFQNLNEGPLSQAGVKISRALSDGNDFLRTTAMKMSFDGRRRLVLENDLVGVLNELGIKPPTRFMNRPMYQRNAIAEMFPTPRAILEKLPD